MVSRFGLHYFFKNLFSKCFYLRIFLHTSLFVELLFSEFPKNKGFFLYGCVCVCVLVGGCVDVGE